jgi:outer membrane protein W
MNITHTIKFLLASLVALFAFDASAQYSLGVSGGMIDQHLFNSYYGGDLHGKYALNEAVRVGVSVGYYQNAPSTIYDLSTGKTEKFISKVIPITVSGEYLFLKNKFRPYVGAQAGLMTTAAVFGSHRGSFNYVCIAPVFGLEYRIARNIGINANLKYNLAMRKDSFSGDFETWKTLQPGIGAVYHF